MQEEEEKEPDVAEVAEEGKKKKKKKKNKDKGDKNGDVEAEEVEVTPAEPVFQPPPREAATAPASAEAAAAGAEATEAPASAEAAAEDAEATVEAEDGEAEEATGGGGSKKKKKKKKGGGAAAAAEAAAATEEKTEAPQAAEKAAEDAAAADGDEAEEGEEAAAGGAKKKKKKKNKSGAGENAKFTLPAQDNSYIRKLRDWPEKQGSRQSPEMSVPVHEQFPAGDYPLGECVEYVGSNSFRTSSAEKRELERIHSYDYEKIRRAAECHRQVRRYAQSYFRPGLTMVELCQRLERKTHELVMANGLECGWGFPTGCSLNWVAAHYTPNYGDNTVLQYDDVCKLDFGVQVGGRIVDCAFTISFNPKYDPIVEASQEGTNAGLKAAGIDARFSDIGESIQEVIESYEIDLDGKKVLPIKPVKNLNGHSIGPYQIHAGKSVPITKNSETTTMEEGEFYAIETFASCGKGYVVEDLDCSHYMKIFDAPHIPLRVKSSKALLHAIEQNFGTLAFCRRWLDDAGQTRHLMALKNLVDNDLVQPYPPLCDARGSYVTQMEHTVLLRPTCKEIVSRGDDF